jgi:hypothetical protein
MVIYDITDYGVMNLQTGIICVCVLQPGHNRNSGTLETKNFHFQKIVINRRKKIFFEMDS